MSKVIMTAGQLVDRLQVLESRPNYYKNNYPSNLCYVHKDGRTSADCVNLYKALLNGYDVDNTTVGYYQRDLSNTGDVDGWSLLMQCTDVSQDFTKLKDGEPRLLYMVHGKDWHVGGFIGEVQKYGRIYNVIEATGAWGGHILYSYVDGKGNRYKSKGGEPRSSWTHHGLMTPWVNYTQEMDELPDAVMQPIDSAFMVRVSVSDLNIRTGPGTNYLATGKFTGRGVFTIVEVKDGKGSVKGWGRLSSGEGWISLDYGEAV